MVVILSNGIKTDPEWSWMNNLTSKEVQGIMEKAIQLDQNK